MCELSGCAMWKICVKHKNCCTDWQILWKVKQFKKLRIGLWTTGNILLHMVVVLDGLTTLDCFLNAYYTNGKRSPSQAEYILLCIRTPDRLKVQYNHIVRILGLLGLGLTVVSYVLPSTPFLLASSPEPHWSNREDLDHSASKLYIIPFYIEIRNSNNLVYCLLRTIYPSWLYIFMLLKPAATVISHC